MRRHSLRNTIGFAAIAMLMLGIGASAQAGSTVAGGWHISWDDSSLDLLSPSSTAPSPVTLGLERASYAITFQQLSRESAALVTLPDLTLINGGDKAWSAISLSIQKGTNGVLNGPSFLSNGQTTLNISSSIGIGGGWSALDSVLIDGGAVRSGATLQAFVLTATPVFESIGPQIPGGDGGNSVIPLPAGAWSGLAGLGILGGIRAWKRRHQLLA